MKNSQEKQLMQDIWSAEIKDSPLKFVKYIFNWGAKDTPLEEFDSPRKWQEKILRDLEIHIARNNGKLDYEMFRLAVASGRGIGKSALVSWLILWFLSTRLGGTIIVTANTESQLRSRTWAELGKWLTLAINGHWFTKTATTIRPADWFDKALKRDLKIDTGYYYAQAQLWSEENPDAFAGIHSTYGVMLVFDEASGIPESIYSVSEGFFTEPTKDRYWLTFSNPRRNTGAFFESFNGKQAFWKNEQIDSRDVEGTDKKLLNDLIEQYGEDSSVAKVEVKGQFPSSDQDTVISLDLVKSAIDRDVALTTTVPIVWGLDVARQGVDKSALAIRQGNTLLEIQTYNSPDLMELCGAIKSRYDNEQSMNKPQEILVDVIGLGAGVVDRLLEVGLPVRGINVAESPSTKGTYLNLRAELWFKVRDWFGGRDVRIPHDNKLISELSSPIYKFNSSGKIKIESKDEMKKRGLQSPDRADALALTMAGIPASFGATNESIMGYNFRKPIKSKIYRVG
jgi:hypothetical protein